MQRYAVFFIFAASTVSAMPFETPSLTATERQRLEAGDTVIHAAAPTDNRGFAIKSLAIIDAPSSAVWPVLRDCEFFEQFMPRTKTSARKIEEGVPLCHIEIQLPFPLRNLWSDTRSILSEKPAGHYQRAWTLVRGTYRRNSGSWTVVPWGAGRDKTLVIYFIDSDPTILIPDVLLRAAQKESIPQVFKAIRRRVTQMPSTP